MSLPVQQPLLLPQPTPPRTEPVQLVEPDSIEEIPDSLCTRVSTCFRTALEIFCMCLDACEEAGRDLPPGAGMP